MTAATRPTASTAERTSTLRAAILASLSLLAVILSSQTAIGG